MAQLGMRQPTEMSIDTFTDTAPDLGPASSEGLQVIGQSTGGGDGVDTVNYADGTGPVVVNLIDPTPTDGGATTLVTGTPGTFSLITETSGDDVLFGDLSNDLIRGLDGNDTLYGGEGNDTLEGGGLVKTVTTS